MKKIYENLDKYEGEFKDDKMNGYGIYTFVDGEQYKGEFKDDNMNGQGVLTYQNGNCYKGEWKNNQFLG